MRAPGAGHAPRARGWLWCSCFPGSPRRVHSSTSLRRRRRIFHRRRRVARHCLRATRCGRRRCSHRPYRGSGCSSLRTKATLALRLDHRPVWSPRCGSERGRGPSSGGCTVHADTVVHVNSVHFPSACSREHRRARWAYEGTYRRRRGGRQCIAWVARACERWILCSARACHTTVPTQARH